MLNIKQIKGISIFDHVFAFPIIGLQMMMALFAPKMELKVLRMVR